MPARRWRAFARAGVFTPAGANNMFARSARTEPVRPFRGPVSDTLRHSLQTSLGTAYTIERELGGGGMSRVYVASDRALGRHVVIKLLPPDLAAGVSTERFKREIQLAARLQHPHIVPLLTAGESDGLPYFTMPYVE